MVDNTVQLSLDLGLATQFYLWEKLGHLIGLTCVIISQVKLG